VTSSYFDTAHWVTVGVTAGVVLTCVLLHYETMSMLTNWLQKLGGMRRRRMLVLMFVLLTAHVVEIWIFGVGMFGLARMHGTGWVAGKVAHGLPDYIYFSAVVYSTLGLGDLVPFGAIRFLVGTEALTGFALITWSASFTFLEMQRFWKVP